MNKAKTYMVWEFILAGNPEDETRKASAQVIARHEKEARKKAEKVMAESGFTSCDFRQVVEIQQRTDPAELMDTLMTRLEAMIGHDDGDHLKRIADAMGEYMEMIRRKPVRWRQVVR